MGDVGGEGELGGGFGGGLLEWGEAEEGVEEQAAQGVGEGLLAMLLGVVIALVIGKRTPHHPSQTYHPLALHPHNIIITQTVIIKIILLKALKRQHHLINHRPRLYLRQIRYSRLCFLLR